jgi:protein-disulfide isomerase
VPQAKRNASRGANRMKFFYGALVAIAVIGVAAIVYTSRAGGGSMATEPLEMANITNASELTSRARGISLGVESAPVDIRVFSDFMCPACATWAGQIEPLLKAEFVQQGKVRLTYYDFPLPQHKFSFAAARAARCASDQGKFWEYHDRLFGTQRQWAYGSSMPVEHFNAVAREVGVDVRAFGSCLRSDQHAEVVTTNRMLGEVLRVSGTPTVFLNGRQLQQWNDYNAVRAAVQAAGGS